MAGTRRSGILGKSSDGVGCYSKLSVVDNQDIQTEEQLDESSVIDVAYVLGCVSLNEFVSDI